MYEFSDKETRKKFSKTEYGRKTNEWLYISLAASLSFVLVIVIMEILSAAGAINADSMNSIVPVLYPLMTIALVTSCYFDGKRDGAIEQYKHSNKISNKHNKK